MLKVLILIFSMQVFAFKLTLIKDVSRTNQTFITRNGKEDGIFKGKKSTFTANNVSIIAKAITVTRDLTQWEIMNDFTDVPFRKGQTVTFYDSKEYLWTLNPEVIKAKYIKSYVFRPKTAVSMSTSLLRSTSESVSGVSEVESQRGGISFEGLFERVFTQSYSLSVGVRYAQETISTKSASLTTQRLLGIFEGKYYFSKIENLNGARFSLSLAIGFGQSQTSTEVSKSSGTAKLLPSTKISFNYPVNKKTDFLFDLAYESLGIDEEFKNNIKQVTTLDNVRFGLGLKRYF